MKIQLSHVAIAVPEIQLIKDKFKALSLALEAEHEVATEKVRVAMVPVEVSKEFRIELLEPTGADSPIARFLEKRKQGLHHLSFEVSNLEKWKEVLEDAAIMVLPPGIRPSARGKALFIHPRDMGGVLVELEEIG